MADSTGLLTVAILVGVAAIFVLLKQLGLVSAKVAAEHLKAGAKVIDVRSPAEFEQKHLSVAINIPLGDLKDRAPQEFPDKRQVLLLHCLSGGRSALGRRVLERVGYKQVFNLGSYGRAERIVNST